MQTLVLGSADSAKFSRRKSSTGEEPGLPLPSTFGGEGASAILHFLTQLMEGNSRVTAWLDSAEHVVFWRPLVALLMLGPSFQPPISTQVGLADSERVALEQAAIEYFITVTRYSEANQTRFSQMVCDALVTLSSQVSARVSVSEAIEGSSAIAGTPLCLPSFLRRLILQVMLEEGRVEVVLRSGSAEEEYILPRQLPSGLAHPEIGAGYGRCIHHGLSTDSLASMAQELLRQRSAQGVTSTVPLGSTNTADPAAIASPGGQTLFPHVPTLATIDDKLVSNPFQGVGSKLSALLWMIKSLS